MKLMYRPVGTEPEKRTMTPAARNFAIMLILAAGFLTIYTNWDTITKSIEEFIRKTTYKVAEKIGLDKPIQVSQSGSSTVEVRFRDGVLCRINISYIVTTATLAKLKTRSRPERIHAIIENNLTMGTRLAATKMTAYESMTFKRHEFIKQAKELMTKKFIHDKIDYMFITFTNFQYSEIFMKQVRKKQRAKVMLEAAKVEAELAMIEAKIKVEAAKKQAQESKKGQ